MGSHRWAAWTVCAVIAAGVFGGCDDPEPQIVNEPDPEVDAELMPGNAAPADPDAPYADPAEPTEPGEANGGPEAYDLGDEQDLSDEQADSEAGGEMETFEGDGLTWQTPSPWTTEPAGGLRYATIDNPDDDDSAEIAVTNFPGDVGGVTANVDRWSQQVGAPPVRSEEDLADLLTELEIDGQNALLVEIDGQDGLKLVAIILPDANQDRTWFFRASGNAEAVETSLEVLRRIAETMRFESDDDEATA